MHIVPDTTDVSIDIRAMTTSGTSLEGKVAADFTLWYRRDGAKVAIELSDLDSLTSDHADGGMKEIDDGAYRLDLPDAVCAAGVNVATVGGTVDGGVVLQMPIDLTAGVPQTIDAGKSLPDVTPGAEGGLPILDEHLRLPRGERILNY